MAALHLLPDPITWRPDLFPDDGDRLVCECKFQIERPDGSSIMNAPVFDLADVLRICFEKALNTSTAATDYLWDTGESVRIFISDKSNVSVELPMGTQPVVLTQVDFVHFVSSCYERGMSALACFPN